LTSYAASGILVIRGDDYMETWKKVTDELGNEWLVKVDNDDD
jgi:hypothetical protein